MPADTGTVAPAVPVALQEAPVTPLMRAWRRAARRPPALVGAAVVLCYVLLALGAPWVAPDDPLRTDWGQIRKAPSAAHLFGTDDLGRDVLSRVIYGTRISMQAGVFSILLAMVVGVPAGLVAGFYRGVFDQAIMRMPGAIIAEAILSFLGLGVQPPRPSWGTMLNTAQQFLESAPWMAWWPGLAIFSLALSFNLAGDGLRDWLDPKDY